MSLVKVPYSAEQKQQFALMVDAATTLLAQKGRHHLTSLKELFPENQGLSWLAQQRQERIDSRRVPQFSSDPILSSF